MNRTKKTALADQTEGGEGCQQMAFADFGYDKYFTTSRTAPQRISDLLMHGSVNSLPLKELKRLTGLDGRIVRRMIQRERAAGACICVDNKTGYFLADSEAEREACARSMFARAHEVAQTAAAIAAAEVGK